MIAQMGPDEPKQGFNWEDGLVFLVIAISLFATIYIIGHYLVKP